MSLITYEDARPWAKAIRDEVSSRRMPPWGAVAGIGDFAGDPSLSTPEIDMLVAWVEGGAPEGDPAYLPHKTPTAAPDQSAAPHYGRSLNVIDSLTLDKPAKVLAIRPLNVSRRSIDGSLGDLAGSVSQATDLAARISESLDPHLRTARTRKPAGGHAIEGRRGNRLLSSAIAFVGRAFLPANRLSSRSSRLERRLRPRLAAPRRLTTGAQLAKLPYKVRAVGQFARPACSSPGRSR